MTEQGAARRIVRGGRWLAAGTAHLASAGTHLAVAGSRVAVSGLRAGLSKLEQLRGRVDSADGGADGSTSAAAVPIAPPAPGCRIVVDARALQDPDRAPTTAIYLEALLGAYAARPHTGESFRFIVQAGMPDADLRRYGLPEGGERAVPPTRLLRAAAPSFEPFILRVAATGLAIGAERSGAAGTLFHGIGGALPIASGMPVVSTLLDLAPWELPGLYQRTPAARFTQRLRAQLLCEAAVVVVGSEATAVAASRLLHIPRERMRVVPLAPRDAFRPLANDSERAEAALELRRLGLEGRHLVFTGRFEARQDLRTLLAALARLAATARPAGLDPSVSWPPRVLLVGAGLEDRRGVARIAAREGVAELVSYAPQLEPERLARVIASARATILPALSESAGLPAIESIACGTPVVAAAVGALPGIVGPAGILVEPRDPDRLAVALSAIWSDDGVHHSVAAAALERGRIDRRSWSDVADEMRRIYADAVAEPVDWQQPGDRQQPVDPQ